MGAKAGKFSVEMGSRTLERTNSVREAVSHAKASSRRGGFACVYGPKQVPSETGGSWFNAHANLGCFFDGKRSVVSLPAGMRQFIREQNKRR